MKLIIKLLIISLTILPFTKTSFAADDLIVWNRGGWGEWVVEGFNKKMEAEGRALRATSTLNPEFVFSIYSPIAPSEQQIIGLPAA